MQVRRAAVRADAIGADDHVVIAVIVDVSPAAQRRAEERARARPDQAQVVARRDAARAALVDVDRPGGRAVVAGADDEVMVPVAVDVAAAGERPAEVLPGAAAAAERRDHTRLQPRGAAVVDVDTADAGAVVRRADGDVVITVVVDVPGARHAEAEVPGAGARQRGGPRGADARGSAVVDVGRAVARADVVRANNKVVVSVAVHVPGAVYGPAELPARADARERRARRGADARGRAVVDVDGPAP